MPLSKLAGKIDDKNDLRENFDCFFLGLTKNLLLLDHAKARRVAKTFALHCTGINFVMFM